MTSMILLVMLLMADSCWCVDHTYHVEENNDIQSYIGDIVTDTHLLDNIQFQDDNSNKLTFNVLQGSSDGSVQLFNVTPGGQLYTAAILDAETLCQYNVECFRTLEIAVQYGHSFIKMLKIKVTIDDVNDNFPMFTKKEFPLKFDENVPQGIKEIIPNAIDKDFSIQNSKLSYQLKEDEDIPFRLLLNKKSRVDILELILEGNLDREKKDIYNLQLIATDGGSPPKEGVLAIQILVKDKNDNIPAFSQNIYNVTVNDTHQINKPVVTLSATDSDEGENGRISYFLSAKIPNKVKKYFKLDKTTGEMFITKEFQFGNIFEIIVEATDNGNTPMSSAAIIFVNGISHLNNPPNFDVKFALKSTGNTAIISEGTKIPSFVAYVTDIDNDSGVNGQVKCHLENRYLQLISIAKKKYKVVVKSEIDRESEKSFNFTIKCQDNGLPPLTVEKQFSMLVTDINDVRPQFSQDIFRFLTYENEHIDFPVGYINATDPDIGDGGELIYSLLTNEKDILPFQISHVGFISTTQSLDREEKKMYEFKVLVKDKGTPSLENTANVVVEVMDLNDNAPYFTFPNVKPFSLNVHYHPRIDHDITVVKASDTDSQHNAFLTYEILRGNEKHLFQMNPHSGVLSFSRSLDQNDAGLYELELAVKDSGNPVLSSTTTLSLTLTISNNTSKILKTPSLKTTTASSNGIQFNVMIIIVIAAVIVSVVIVISISICIVHRLKQTDSNYNSSVVDMYHKVTPTLNVQSKYMFDPTCVLPGVKYSMERNLMKSQQPMVDGDDIHCRTISYDRWGNPSFTEPHQQMFVPREESMSPGYRELNGTDEFSEMSTLSFHTDSGHGWSVGSAGHYEELPDLCRYQIDQTWNRRNQLTLNRSKGDNNGYLHQPNVDLNTSCHPDQIPLTMTGNTSNIIEHPSTVPMTSHFTTNCKPPLPAVPKVTTLSKVPSIPQVPPFSTVNN